MPRTRLHKSRAVKRLLTKLKKLAPHLMFVARDRETHYASIRRRYPPPWLTVAKMHDDAQHAVPIAPQPAREMPKAYTASGESIPRKPKNKLADADLSDKPKR